MLSNKDRVLFGRLATSMEACAREDKSKAAKELRKETAAWEKAVGGKQKLDEAAAILVAAFEQRTAILAEGAEEVREMIRKANDRFEAAKADIDAEEQGLLTQRTRLGILANELKDKERALADSDKALALSEAAVEERDAEQDRRDAGLNTRDIENTRREAEIKRFDAWRATAPA